MVRYTDGHLHRINGEARKARRLLPEAQREFADAVAAFREAAELRPDWPDPYLGLARTFIYGLDDVDRAADAFQRAERAGYTPGSREAAQLGDGYRSRADTLMRSARDVAGLAQERDYLTRAVERVPPRARTLRESHGLYRRAAEHRAGAAELDDGRAPAHSALSVPPSDSTRQDKPWR